MIVSTPTRLCLQNAKANKNIIIGCIGSSHIYICREYIEIIFFWTLVVGRFSRYQRVIHRFSTIFLSLSFSFLSLSALPHSLHMPQMTVKTIVLLPRSIPIGQRQNAAFSFHFVPFERFCLNFSFSVRSYDSTRLRCLRYVSVISACIRCSNVFSFVSMRWCLRCR